MKSTDKGFHLKYFFSWPELKQLDYMTGGYFTEKCLNLKNVNIIHVFCEINDKDTLFICSQLEVIIGC